MKFPLAEMAEALGAGNSATGWSTDTRTLQRGDFFIPLRGPNHDGHEHLATAFAKGAVGALVDRDVAVQGFTIRVADTLRGLQTLAAWARQRWGGDVIGVTGSAGKTTTKEIIASFLGMQYRVGKTVGNFNNHVGLPLSILRLPDDAQVAVLELGMNHAGEIRELAGIARPRVGRGDQRGSGAYRKFCRRACGNRGG